MYNLELSRDQLVVLQDALESYFRIRINQWDGLAEELASVGYVYDKKDPDNAKKFDAYLERREKAKALFEQAMAVAQPQGTRRVTPQNVLIAEDIWQVIRHQLYLDSAPSDFYCTAGNDPIQMSSHQLPKLTKNDEEG